MAGVGEPGVKLYRLPGSHYAVRAEMLLRLKGVPYERVNLTYLNYKRVLEPLSNQDEVPVLVSGGDVVTWRNIPGWLDRRFPEPPIFPSDARERALADSIEEFADLVLGHLVRRLGFWNMREDAHARRQFFGGKGLGARVSAEATTWWTMRNYGVTPFVVDQDEQTLAATVRRLSALLRENGNLVSRQITSADVAVVALLKPLTALSRYQDAYGDTELFRWIGANYEAWRPRKAPVAKPP